MATRNRTEEFLSLRALHRPEKVPLPGDRESLIHRADNTNDTEMANRATTGIDVPPRWLTVFENVRQIQRSIATEHHKLESLHREHLKVAFGRDEREIDQEERDIEGLSQTIQQHFKLAESEIKELEAQFRAELQEKDKSGGTDAELTILHNVKTCLVNDVSALSRVVRESHRRYLKSLEQQKAVRDRHAGGARQKEVEERLQRNAQVDEYLERGCTQEQIESIMLNNRLVDERDKEFQQILSSIKSLHEMFQDLHGLVIEQGTLLDRIDYNMTLTHKRVVAGRKELVQAKKYQEAGTFKICILLLIVLIIGFILALVVKVML